MPVFKLLLTPKSWPILPIFVDPLKLLQNTVPTKKYFFIFLFLLKVVFFRKCWCICHNIPTFYIPELWNLNFVDFTVALVTQALPSCPYHPLNCHLEHCQFPSKFQSPKFKISNSGKRKVHMFEEMTNASVLWEKSYLYKKPLKVTSDSKLILNDSRGSLKLV